MNDAESRMRELLQQAEPLLTAPPDRVAEVGARVRHTHQKNLLGVCLSAVLMAAVAFIAWPKQAPVMPVLGGNGCPTAPFHGPWKGDADGKLVPDEAITATLCEIPLAAESKVSPRTLNSRVGELTKLLNSLPPSKGDARCAQRETSSFSLVLKYPQGPPVIAFLDVDCGQIYVDGGVRLMGPLPDNLSTSAPRKDPAPIDTFRSLYRKQITDSRPLMIPQCASTVHGADLRFTGLRDDMADLREPGDPFVHSNLWALAACEYTGSLTTSWTRQKQATQQEAMWTWRDRINGAARQPLALCGRDKPPSTVYLVWLVDVTGSVTQLVITKEPCFAVFAGDFGGWTLSSEFVTGIENLLGYR